MTQMHSLTLAAALGVIVLGSQAASAQSYTVQDIGTLGGNTVLGLKINASGAVAGFATTAAGVHHGFVFDGTGLHDLGVFPNAVSLGKNPAVSGAVGINASGQIAGFATGSNKALNAFLHTGDGPLTNSDNIGALGGGYSQALGINDAGDVVGSASTTTSQHAFYYDGTMHDLGALRTFDSATAFGVNASGVVVGFSSDSISLHGTTRAFRTGAGGAAINAATDDLGTLGGSNAFAYAVNASGTVIGYSTTSAGDDHAFRTAAGHTINPLTDDLGVLAGDTRSFAEGINSAGVVVGYNGNVDSKGIDIGDVATLFNGTSWVDLNSLVSVGSGFTLTAADGINDRGQIVASGMNASGDEHTFLLTPSPEPSAAASLAIGVLGLSGLAFTARKRRIAG